MPVGTEVFVGMPAFHERPDDPLGLAISFGRGRPGKALLNPGFAASPHKDVPVVTAFVFGTVVGQDALNGVGSFLKHLPQEGGRTPVALIRIDPA